jgi:glycosyltransferase involved in cell wall biosynthesis
VVVLSILIPTLRKRKQLLDRMIANLRSQIKNPDQVEILTYSDNGEMTTGFKRNKLLERSKGKYVVFIDDDDDIPEYYVEEILKGAKSNCDSMAINGTMRTHRLFTWDIRQSNPYKQIGNHFLRYPNHITPIKRKHAIKIGFPNKTIGEDFEFATKLRDAKLLQTEYVIKKPMYLYKPSK